MKFPTVFRDFSRVTVLLLLLSNHSSGALNRVNIPASTIRETFKGYFAIRGGGIWQMMMAVVVAGNGEIILLQIGNRGGVKWRWL